MKKLMWVFLALVTLLGSAAPAAAADNSVHFVWWADRPYLLVNQEQPAGARFEARQASFASDGFTMRVVDPIVKGTEGKALAAQMGQSFELRGSSQATCTAVAQRAVRISMLIGPDTLSSDVDVYTEGGRWIALELQPTASDCSPNFFWARAAGGPPLTIVQGVRGGSSPALQTAIEGTTMWKVAQREYATFDRNSGGEEGGDPNSPLRTGRWDAKGATAESVRFASALSAPITWQQVTAGEGCGDFIGGVMAVWVEEGGLLRLASPQDKGMEDAQRPAFWRPEIAVDIDGDGILELIGPGVLYRRSGQLWQVKMRAPVLYTGDPC